MKYLGAYGPVVVTVQPLMLARELVGGGLVDPARGPRRRCLVAMCDAAVRPAISAAIVDGE